MFCSPRYRGSVLIIGCGDIGLRAAKSLLPRYRVFALTRTRSDTLRHAGIVPLSGDLDDRQSLGRIAGVADALLHFAPPQITGRSDTRTRNLLAALSRSPILPRVLIYISTSGVYGDRRGALTRETTPCKPESPRAIRRLDAEQRLRDWSARNGVRLNILRAPGIYADERLPTERLRKGMPVLTSEEDSYSNHIHADDLARVTVLALRYGRAGRIYNVCDDSRLKMGDYFDLIADHVGLPKPPRIRADEAARSVDPLRFSFMRESRCLDNRRGKRELRWHLKFPDVARFLRRE